MTAELLVSLALLIMELLVELHVSLVLLTYGALTWTSVESARTPVGSMRPSGGPSMVLVGPSAKSARPSVNQIVEAVGEAVV